MRKGQKHTAAAIAKMTGRKCSDSTRQKMSAGNSGKPKSDVHCANISAALTGRSIPSSTKSKMSASALLRWQRQKQDA